MSFDNIKDLACGQVLSASGTKVVLHAGEGANMPPAPFRATAFPVGLTPVVLSRTAKLVRVIEVKGDELVLEAAASGIQPGWQFANTVTASAITALQAAIAAAESNAETVAEAVASGVAAADVAAERGRAEAAEASKASIASLVSEASARESGDAAAGTAITAEASRAKAAETAAEAGAIASATTKDATHAALTTTAHGGIVASADPRLSDARTPTAHAPSHAPGGSDPLTTADLPASVVTSSRAVLASSSALVRAMAEPTPFTPGAGQPAESITPRTSGEGSGIASASTTSAIVGGVLNPSAPWLYQLSDMAPTANGKYAQVLSPYEEWFPENGKPKRSLNYVTTFAWQLAHDFDGAEICYRLLGETEYTVRVWVNGVPSTWITSSKGFLLVKFAAAAKRRLMLEVARSAFLEAIIIPKTSTVYPPTANSSCKFAMLGDSFSTGGGTTSGGQASCYAAELARALGYNQHRIYGFGGTGVVRRGPEADPYGPYGIRVSNLQEYQPNLIFVEGSINDFKMELALIRPAVKLLLEEIKTACPTATVIGCSPMPMLTLERTKAHEETAAAYKAAYEELGVPYIDAYGHEWVLGNGHEGATTGEGNSDIYAGLGEFKEHPSNAGHLYLARRLAREIASKLSLAL